MKGTARAAGADIFLNRFKIVASNFNCGNGCIINQDREQCDQIKIAKCL